MHLYKVNLIDNSGLTGIYGETLYVQAGNEKKAIQRAFEKFERRYPTCGVLRVKTLELIEENW